MNLDEFKKLIDAYAKEIYHANYGPDRAHQILSELVALEGNINDFKTACAMAYNFKLMECYKSEAKANRAKLLANTSPEYEKYEKIKNLKELTEGIISTIKIYIRAQQCEQDNAKFH